MQLTYFAQYSEKKTQARWWNYNSFSRWSVTDDWKRYLGYISDIFLYKFV